MVVTLVITVGVEVPIGNQIGAGLSKLFQETGNH